jgi:hypothetical protein
MESSGHCGKGSGQQPRDVPELKALVTELYGLEQLLQIKRPPLASAKSSPIC